MSLRNFLVIAPLGLALMSLGGCNINRLVYRADVHQGNLITQEVVEQLEVGMSREQVVFLMGEPLIKSLLRADRWDYTYYLNPRFGEPQTRYMTLFFDESNRLVRIVHSEMPTERQADEMIMGLPTDFDPKKQAPLVETTAPSANTSENVPVSHLAE